MWGYIILLIAIIVLLIDLYFAFVSIEFLKKRCGKCKGYLVRTIQHKNIYIRRHFYRHYLDFVYVYRVNEKEYNLAGRVPATKSMVRSVVEVIYQKKNPKLAYIKNLTIPNQPIISILLCPAWIILVVLGVYWI